MEFPFCKKAIEANKQMPLKAVSKVEKMLGNSLHSKKILLLGVSYLQDVGDTRYSPSEPFVVNAENKGATVISHDPLLDFWEELDRKVLNTIPDLKDIDAVIFAVQHNEYQNIDLYEWSKGYDVAFLDAHNVLTNQQVNQAIQKNVKIEFIGKGIQ